MFRNIEKGSIKAKSSPLLYTRIKR